MSRVGRTLGDMDPAFTVRRPVEPLTDGANMRGLVIVPKLDLLTPVLDREALRRQNLAGALKPLIANLDSDLECEHGRLAGDPYPVEIWPHDFPCGCYPQESLPIEHEELIVDAITAPHHASRATDAPEAPYGYKADGTPRKRPTPSPEQQAAAAAGRDAYFAQRRAEREAAEAAPAPAVALAEPPAPDPTPEPVSAPTGVVARFLVEIDERVDALNGEISERERQIAEFATERDELLETREKLLR